MDRYQHIEQTRFLGAEFLTWLWFKLDLFEGHFELAEGGPCEVWIESNLVLTDPDRPHERVTLHGKQPSQSAEAASALRDGKLPVKAGLRLTQGTQEYLFTFDARSFAMSSVKLPAVLTQEADEPVYERLRLLQELDRALSQLFGEFLTLRLASVWDQQLTAALAAWARGRPTLTKRQYQGLLKRAAPRQRRR